MKERKIILGDLIAVHSDLGLDIYHRDNGEKVMWLNQKSIEKLITILSLSDSGYEKYIRKEKLDKIKYRNQSYKKKKK